MGKIKSSAVKRLISAALILLVIPAVIGFGIWLFADRRYNIISVIVALISCVPFFIRFERGKRGSRELTVIAVMTAFSVLGRIVFAPIPAFKPVTAITVIAGSALGAEGGFMIGSLSAIVSNMFFGQGPWTPFQMLVWGLVGFISGLILRPSAKPNRLLLSLMGVLGGAMFSLVMDVWTTFSLEEGFSMARYLATVVGSAPTMILYAVSNVVFLLILARPFFEKLLRIRKKYGVFGGAP